MSALDATRRGHLGAGRRLALEVRDRERHPGAAARRPDKKVAKSYGASAPVVGTRRAVFIVDEEGKLAYKHVHTLGLDFQTVDEIKEALESLPARG